MGTTSWTINELKEEVRRALSVGYVPAASARVRAVPDARTIRYYTTLGLLDRPAFFRGRTAYYQRRHLLQLVAIKRLQGEGHSLSEVQAQLAGLDDAGLEGVATLPDDDLVEAPTPSRRANFWEAVPAAATATASVTAAPRPVQTTEASDEPVDLTPLVGVPLTGGVTLLLHTQRPLAGPDLQAIRAAAGTLLRALRGRGILEDEEEASR